jgi:hypothetical protein
MKEQIMSLSTISGASGSYDPALLWVLRAERMAEAASTQSATSGSSGTATSTSSGAGTDNSASGSAPVSFDPMMGQLMMMMQAANSGADTSTGTAADAGSSGGVSPPSPDQALQSLFSQLDTSGSGSLTEQQFVQGMQSLTGQGTSGTGTGTDGTDSTDSTQALEALFTKLSGGGSTLTEQQFVQGMESMGPPPPPPPPLGGPGSGGGSAQATQDLQSLFSQLDTSGSGSLTEQQFVQGMQSLLASADGSSETSTGSTAGTGDTASSTAGLKALFNRVSGGGSTLTSSQFVQGMESLNPGGQGGFAGAEAGWWTTSTASGSDTGSSTSGIGTGSSVTSAVNGITDQMMSLLLELQSQSQATA